ncbi:hypothetical protein ACHAXN_008354 [Cyclotella atomus]
MCNATINSIEAKHPQHELIHSPHLIIEDLRSRLSRRNAILDTIRKAYHRDVIAVKEHLIDLSSRGILPNNHDPYSFLSTVPSLDIRPALLLFAPQECELELHPCHLCGGQLEIIHRESSRIAQYKRAIELLQDKEKELRCQVVDARVDVKDAQACRDDVIQNAKVERDVLLDQIKALKYELADRNALERELKETKQEKQLLEKQIELQKPLMEERERLLVEMTVVRQELDTMTQQFHAQVKENRSLQSEKEDLTHQLDSETQENEYLVQQLAASQEQCQKLEDTCAALTSNLSKSKEATIEAESCLHKAEEAIYELEFDLEQQKEDAESKISDLESKNAELTNTAAELDKTSRRLAEEAAKYRRRIDDTLLGAMRRGSIISVPKSGDTAFAKTDELIRELDIYRLKVATLSNLLLSCIRSAYENCLVQENILRDNRSGLHENKKMLHSAPPTNEKARMVLESLNTAQESDALEWASSFRNDSDLRHVLGNLQNRLQLGQFSLGKCFEKVHKEAAADMRKCQESHEKKIDEMTNRIWELEKLLTEAIKLNRWYEDKMRIMRDKHENAEQILEDTRCTLRKLRKDCHDNNSTTVKLRIDYDKLRPATEKLLQELAASREEIISLNASLQDKQGDIEARDDAIQQLENLLESITHRYAENERMRIKVTHEIAIQAVVATKDMCCVADFLPTPLRTVTANDDDSKSKMSCDALIPGRIIQIQDNENWPMLHQTRTREKQLELKYPSRVNLNVKPPSSLNYRRAIDRL